jgi:hypothetical protein
MIFLPFGYFAFSRSHRDRLSVTRRPPHRSRWAQFSVSTLVKSAAAGTPEFVGDRAIESMEVRPFCLLLLKFRIAAKVTRWLSKAPSPRPGGEFAGRISPETPLRRGLRAGKCDFYPKRNGVGPFYFALALGVLRDTGIISRVGRERKGYSVTVKLYGM